MIRIRFGCRRRPGASGFAVPALLAGALALAAPTIVAPAAQAAELPKLKGVEVAEFTVMGHRFRIPTAYLTDKDDLQGGVIDEHGEIIFMRGLVPDLRPIPPRRKEEYAGGEGLAFAVSFGIWTTPKPGSHYDWYSELVVAGRCAAPRRGYRTCAHWLFEPGKPSYADKEAFVSADPAKPFIFECKKTGLSPNPQCVIEVALFAEVELRVRFSRIHLNRAEQLVARAYGIVCAAFVPTPGSEPEIDHCK